MTIERVKELLAKATPGEWEATEVCDAVCGRSCTPDGCSESHPSGRFSIVGPSQDWEFGGGLFLKADEAQLLAAAPDIARLAIELSEEVERLRGKYEKP
jgi:hypothetical protein